MNIRLAYLCTLGASLLICSCQSTAPPSAPTVASLDRYYKEAETRAKAQIADLTVQRDNGQLSADEYDVKVQRIKDSIAAKANELAWTRHELVESELRTKGIPTGGYPQTIQAPALGGVNGSLYHTPGDPGGNQGNQTFTPPTSGFTPGTMAGMAATGGFNVN